MKALNNVSLLGIAAGLAAGFYSFIINLPNGFDTYIWPLVSMGWIINYFMVARAHDKLKDNY